MPPSVRAFSRIANSTAGRANPVPVPKPTGLTVGDLMVAFIVTNGTTPTSYPSGFSLLMSDVATTAYHKGLVYTKVADSGDVAASQFTFGNPSLSSIFIGIYAVRDWDAIEYSACRGVVSGASSFPGFDPAASNDLMLAFSDRSGSTVAFSTTNNNPSWTVDSETAYNWATACYHATYAADTVTGTCQWATTAHRFEAMVAISAATTLTAVAQTLSPTYNIRSLAAQTLTPAYAIRNLAAQTFTPGYGIRQFVTGSLTPAYGIRQLVATTITPTYNVRGLVAAVLTPTYDIEAIGLTAVAQTLTPVYSLRQLASQTLTPIYDVRTGVAQTFSPGYNIRQFTAQTLTPTYGVLNLAAQTLTPTYLVRELVGASLTPTYAILFVGVLRHTKRLHLISEVAIMEDPPRINKHGIIDIRDTIRRLPNKGVVKI